MSFSKFVYLQELQNMSSQTIIVLLSRMNLGSNMHIFQLHDANIVADIAILCEKSYLRASIATARSWRIMDIGCGKRNASPRIVGRYSAIRGLTIKAPASRNMPGASALILQHAVVTYITWTLQNNASCVIYYHAICRVTHQLLRTQRDSSWGSSDPVKVYLFLFYWTRNASRKSSGKGVATFDFLTATVSMMKNKHRCSAAATIFSQVISVVFSPCTNTRYLAFPFGDKRKNAAGSHRRGNRSRKTRAGFFSNNHHTYAHTRVRICVVETACQ